MANSPDVLTYDLIFDNDPSNSIQLKNSLGSSIQSNLTIEFIIKKIQSFPEYQSLRLNIELLLYIANILHELESNNRIKGDFKSLQINKKELIVKAYTKVFNLNGTEIQQLQQMLEFLEKHHKIIGIPKYKKIFKWISDVFFYLLKRLL